MMLRLRQYYAGPYPELVRACEQPIRGERVELRHQVRARQLDRLDLPTCSSSSSVLQRMLCSSGLHG